MTRGWRAGATIVLVCLLCYANSFRGSFHFDDFHSLVDNPGIRTLANVPRFFADPGLFSGDADKAMYRPVLLLTYALNYALGEYQVRGYHFVNLALHALCSLLVWLVSKRLFGDEGTGLFCGLLFAAHPLGTEPVNYISSRSETLAAGFYLATFFFYLKDERKYRWLPVVCYGLGLLTKSVVVTAPVLLWLFDWWVRKRVRNWRIYAPYAALAAGYLLLIYQNGFLARSLAEPVRGKSAQLWTQIKAMVYYLKLVFVPHPLNVEHQFFESGGPGEGAVIGGLALVASLGVLAWWGRRRGVMGFALAWSGVVLLPATVMRLNMLVNERRLYLVLVGFVWICGHLRRHVQRSFLYACLPLLGILAFSRNPVWRDELTLWRDAARKAPGMYRVQTNLGKARQQSGDSQAALQAYLRAIEIDPRHGDAYNNIATLYHLDGRLDEAIAWYHRALERYPGYEEIYQNLGDAYTQKGQLAEGIEMYQRALEIDARDGAIWSNFGQTLYRAGCWEEAEEAFWKAVELMPDQPEPYNNLGNIYSRQGENERAVDMYRKAVERDPDRRPEVLVNLGDTYREMGRLPAAREVLERAAALDPAAPLVHFQRGRVERDAGRPAAAIQAFQRAADLDADHARARVEWAELLAEQGNWQRAKELFQAAVEIDSAYSRAWYGLGESLEQLGDTGTALMAYSRFLQIWPHQDQRFRQVAERVRRLQEGR